MPRTTDLGTAIETRRAAVDRIEKAQAQFFNVRGTVQCNGTGEAIVDILFPCLFTIKPRFYYGAELAPGGAITSGSIPTATCVVLSWDSRVRDDGTVIYSGATLGIVTTGPTGQVMKVQWHMSGTGLRGPVPDILGS